MFEQTAVFAMCYYCSKRIISSMFETATKIKKMDSISFIFVFVVIFYWLRGHTCDVQVGPDPWNYNSGPGVQSDKVKDYTDIPPDLRIYPKKPVQTHSNLGIGEWFFKRILSIVLKGGQTKKNEDGSIEISLQMRLDRKQWDTLEDYTSSTTALSEDMYRRSVGYIEEAIYQPSVAEKVIMAWGDYFHMYLAEYKTQVTWTLAALAASGGGAWLWSKMSHKHFVIITFIILYLYEVFTSYKEAEKQELERFVSAVNSCTWFIWSSSCEVPKPDPLIFIKHMNPLKICIRMFTTVVSEPMIILSDTLKTIVHGITDGLWYPFDKMMYGILIITLNIILLMLLIMILFNYIFNIPFNLGFLGLVSLRIKQRNRTLFGDGGSVTRPMSDNARAALGAGDADRISGETFNRFLDVFQQALTHNNNAQQKQTSNLSIQGLKSTNIFTDIPSTSDHGNKPFIENAPRKINNLNHIDGSGDAQLWKIKSGIPRRKFQSIFKKSYRKSQSTP